MAAMGLKSSRSKIGWIRLVGSRSKSRSGPNIGSVMEARRIDILITIG